MKEEYFRKDIERLRAETDEAKQKDIKKNLPCVTPSGTFSERCDSGLVKHSGFICIDLDGKQNPGIDFAALRDSVSDNPYIFFAALSARGNGLFIIIPIAYPSKHRQHFEALRLDFQEMQLKIDSCPDVSRLRYVSYDPDAIINYSAKTYHRYFEPPQQERTAYSGNTSIDSLRRWVERSITFVNGSRHEYIKQFAAALHRFGIPENTALSECLRYSQPDFKENEIRHIVGYMYKNITYFNSAKR